MGMACVSSTEKEKTMLNEKEFYQYVEANIFKLSSRDGRKESYGAEG